MFTVKNLLCVSVLIWSVVDLYKSKRDNNRIKIIDIIIVVLGVIWLLS